MKKTFLILSLMALFLAGFAYADLSDGLIRCYPFDTDASEMVIGDDMTVTGATHETTDCAVGSGCYSFDGDGDHLDASVNLGLTGNSVRSFAFWTKQTTYPSAPQFALQYGTYGTNKGWSWFFNAGPHNATDTWWLIGWEGDNDHNTSIALTQVWTFWVITHNGTDTIFYKDGSPADVWTHSFDTGDSPLYLGWNGIELDAGWFDGIIDEVMVWDKSLNENEIVDLYNRGAGFSCKSMYALCGNSIIEGDEQCDDGNTENNDGCSSICIIELDYLLNKIDSLESRTSLLETWKTNVDTTLTWLQQQIDEIKNSFCSMVSACQPPETACQQACSDLGFGAWTCRNSCSGPWSNKGAAGDAYCAPQVCCCK